MPRIALLSDTHGHLDDGLLAYLQGCDEIWHAGDIGDLSVTDRLAAIAPVRAVHGNIDGAQVRTVWKEDAVFTIAGLKVVMTHIGGYPGRYVARVRQLLLREQPGLYICGHSHILKVMRDPALSLLHMNPGAAGIHGFHKVRTLLRFTVEDGRILAPEAVELGLRGALPPDGQPL